MDEQLLLSDSDGTLACCACQGLLDDPRQLQCLHNCCCRCTNTIAAKEGGRSVTCPECGQVTDVEAATRNYFMTARLSRFKALVEAKTCGVCKEEGNASQPALVWCASCRRSLCSECMPGHTKYNRTHTTVLLDEVRSWDAVCPAPVITCPQHGKPFDFVCFTCEAMLCVDCWVSCNKGRHDVQHVGDASVSSYVTKILDDVRRRQSDLQNKLPQLSATIGLPEEVERAREDALAGLKQRKRQVMVAVDDAYASAEESIRNSFDSLRVKATELSSAAASLDRKISYTVSYGEAIVKTGEACSVIHQQKHLVGHLSALSAEVDAIKQSMDVADILTVDSCIPENLFEVVAIWIGLPQPTGGDLTCSEAAQTVAKAAAKCDDVAGSTTQNKLDIEENLNATNEDLSAAPNVANVIASPTATVDVATARQQLALEKSGASSQGDGLRLDLATSGKRLRFPGECWDVAVTPDGHLLLAALRRGLRDFDIAGGRELSGWRPARKPGESSEDHCWVTRVDCLPDGRAVVAVSYKDRRRAAESTVAVLRCVRSGGVNSTPIWTEERRLGALSSPAQQLSVSEEHVAIAECEPGGGWSWLPGRQVTLVSLSSGKTLWQRKLDYRVQSVALAGRFVVTASSGTLSLRGGRSLYVVDGHSHAGDRLWRQALIEPVNDLCSAAPWASSSAAEPLQLCLAQRDGLWTIQMDGDASSAEPRDSARVRIGNSTDSCKSYKAVRVSIGKWHGATAAALSDDWWTVTVYRAASSIA